MTDSRADLVQRAERLLADYVKLRAEVAADIGSRTDAVVSQALHASPLDSLRPYLDRGTRLGGLANSRFRTVADIQSVPARNLTQVPGIDIETARAVSAAAHAQADHIRATARPRLTARRDSALVTNLIVLAKADTPVKQLRRLLPRLHTDPSLPVDKVAALLDRVEAARRPEPDVWSVYRRNPLPVDRLLGEFSSGTTTVDATQGFVGADVSGKAEQVDVDRSLLRTELRGYQLFGVQYALSRERVLLCDELGLGKTVQALAVAAHLAAVEKLRHVLVICPANTSIHWVNEAAEHTSLTAIEIRGSQRDARLVEWKAKGGLAIVTFTMLRRVKIPEPPGLVIVDEAHLLRDPKSDSARAVRNVLTADQRIMFLSGVPMHNRLGGFRHLTDFLQPDIAGKVAPNAGARGSVGFRRAVGGVYLRRDCHDVVDELPPRISTEEWVRFNRADRERYRRAVASSNFNAIRQGAWPSEPGPSAKLDRLIELTGEAHIDGAHVVVFSQFLPVLNIARKALPGRAFGTRETERFTAHRGPATLLAQTGSGPLDLRRLTVPIVIVVAEPHWQPRIERQVIGRTQRISELPTLRVHRLLARASIDEPLRRLALNSDQAPHQDELVRAEQDRLATTAWVRGSAR